MTSGAKPRLPGTSICGQGVLAVTVRLVIGVVGSPLIICRLQLFDPHDVGVNWITRLRHEPGPTTAGNGLLISVKSGHDEVKETLDTVRLHSPTLQMEMVFSASDPAQTSPKSVEPVIRIVPGGTLPETGTNHPGLVGSLLAIEIAPDLLPKLVG